MSDHKKREQMLAEDDGYPPGLTKQIRFPRYKCLTCNEVIDYDDTISMDTQFPSQMCCPCRSDQLVECDRDWAMRELQDLRDTFKQLASLEISAASGPVFTKLMQVCAQNATQVEDWISEQ